MLIFWPYCELGDGIIFGWRYSDICVVVGAFSFGSYADAQSALNHFIQVAEEVYPKDHPFFSLAILGECFSQEQRKKKSLLPRLSWYESGTQATSFDKFIFYQRWREKSMRFFSLNEQNYYTHLHESSATMTQFETPASWASHLLKQSILCGVSLSDNMKTGIHPCVIQQINHADAIFSSLSRATHARYTPKRLDHRSAIRRYRHLILKIISAIRMNLYKDGFDRILKARSISAFVQQAHVRFDQLNFIFQRFGLSTRGDVDITNLSTRYISFYNCVWLMLNDVVMGMALSIFIRENHNFLNTIIHSWSKRVVVDLIRASLSWLDDWPAGLKLNTELSGFYYLVFSGLFELWEAVIHRCAAMFPYVVHVFGFIGPFGLTLQLGLLLDAISVITAPLYLSYLMATAVFRRMFVLAFSLFNLFRGRRHNVLRDRTDSWDFDVDQLLLGTILFTLVAFLFPTVGIYYYLFALCRIFIISIHGFLDFILTFMNYFPLFALMLGIKDPARLPAGVIFEFTPGGNVHEAHLVLKNSPLTYSKIFDQFLHICPSTRYSPSRLVKQFLIGYHLAHQ